MLVPFDMEYPKKLKLTVITSAQLKLDVFKKADCKPNRLMHLSDCKEAPEIVDGTYYLYRPESLCVEDELFLNSDFHGIMSVLPMARRVGPLRDKEFYLGVDMRIAKIFELSNKDKDIKRIEKFKKAVRELSQKKRTRR